MTRVMKIFTVKLLVMAFFFSCSTDVIKRNNYGKRPREGARKSFGGIKKKIALLTFFNEAPYGGEDLGLLRLRSLKESFEEQVSLLLMITRQKYLVHQKRSTLAVGLSSLSLQEKQKLRGLTLFFSAG